MNLKSTLILLAVLGLLLGGYWLMSYTEQETQRRDHEARRVLPYPAESFERITIHQAGGVPVTGVRESEAEWRIVEPREIDAAHRAWNRVAHGLSQFTNQRTIAEAVDEPEMYGLDNPEITVRVTPEDGDSREFRFGQMEPTQTMRYVQGPDGNVFLAQQDFFQEFDRDLLNLRDRFLITAGEDDAVTRVEFARIRPEETAALVFEGEDGEWFIREPFEALAHTEMVERMVEDIIYGVGDRFIDDPEDYADYGLDPPGAQLTVKTESQPEGQTLYFGSFTIGGGDGEGEDGGIYVRRADRDNIIVASAALLNSLPDHPDQFRQRELVTRRARDMRRLTYTRGDHHFVLEQDEDTGWTVAEPAMEDEDQAAISNFIRALMMLEGGRHLDEEAGNIELMDPEIEIEIEYAGGAQPHPIQLGMARVGEEEQRYAIQDSGAAFAISEQATALVRLDAFDFRRGELLPFSIGEATAVDLSFEGTDYRFVHDGEAWTVEEPMGMRLETQGDMMALLEALQETTAVGMEQSEVPVDLGPFGLELPLMQVSVTADDETVGPLVVGDPAEDNPQHRFATAEGRSELLRVSQSLVNDVREALRGVVEED